MDPSTGKIDFIEFDSPIELLQALIRQSGKDGLAIDKLCTVSNLSVEGFDLVLLWPSRV